ncbi:U4/U6 small nuclear ribonucleoprotein Prp4-like [Paramacrobiotus metropolitanus]|uniref:U4/U6 small nuclear ribonucleoprotein Prp4-like n=1 Tax=Paramacrobiotus metropolitanus TaxID=2943436 RepID=UPI002445D596|nr:U4/U6 small nuclear ribonucleoprotein Prp4-like [Paramacrobiotus metropolitanus]
MSDEEFDGDDEIGDLAAKRQKFIHFGSLDQQSLPQESDSRQTASGTPATDEYFDLEQVPDTARDEALAEFERRKRARQINVPTDDIEIQIQLRAIGEPICLFGEDKQDRRERLRKLLSVIGDIQQFQKQKEEDRKRKELDTTTWYHEGPESLRLARLFLAQYSLPRSKLRLEKQRDLAKIPASQRMAVTQDAHKRLREFTNYCSQIGDNRPLSYCSFSPNSQLLATSSWSGLSKIWTIPECKPVRTLRGHAIQVGCIVFHPQSTIGQDEKALNLASCAADGTVKLWNLTDDTPIGSLDGHQPQRVSRVQFHPSGKFLGTCCFDQSWRLFDMESSKELLHQEGHSKEVYCIAFHPDGSLALTGGLDSYGRVWDIRTGRCIMFLEGHLKSILSVDFASNGYHMATASEDNSCKIWDLRQRAIIYSIPAHTQLVSSVQFEPNNSMHLITASYDRTVKLWAHPGWTLLKTLSGHENKVMHTTMSPDLKYIASASYDRTFKLWAPE